MRSGLRNRAALISLKQGGGEGGNPIVLSKNRGNSLGRGGRQFGGAGVEVLKGFRGG